MGFAEGFNAGSSGLRGAMQMAYDQDRQDKDLAMRQEEQSWRRAAEAERVADRQRVDQAAGSMEALQGGVYDGSRADFRALRDSDAGPTQPPAGGLKVPAVDGGEMPAPRRATAVELNDAAARVALSKRDIHTWSALNEKGQKLQLDDARRTEFKRVRGMKDTELSDLFQQSVNANPDVPAMVDFDPKAKKYVIVSKIPGIPTQQLSRAEMEQAVMGAWEAGSGDYAAGVQAMIGTVTQQRAMQNQNFDRSQKMATGNADLYFKGRQADNDDTRTANDSARLGVLRQDAERKAQLEKMGLVRQYQDPKTGEVREFYPVTTKGGVEWQEFERPKGLVPVNPKSEAAPAKEVPTEGTKMQSGGRAWVADGNGGKLDLQGVVPSKRSALLSKIGFDKSVAETLQWTPDGRYVAWGGMAYDANSPQDMAELKRTVDQHLSDSAMASDVQARGYAPRYPIDRDAVANRGVAANTRALGLARQRP